MTKTKQDTGNPELAAASAQRASYLSTLCSRSSAPVLIGLAVLFLALFWKTVFLGENLSRLCQLGQWDSFFSSASCAPADNIDISVAVAFPEAQFFIERTLSAGSLPLWCPDLACGFPFVGDPQSYLFSPFHALFPASNSYLRSLIVVFNGLLGLILAFAFARLWGLSRSAAAMTATCFGLCPHILRLAEINNNNWMVPGAYLIIFWACANRSCLPSLRASAAGLGIAVAIACVHPECLLVFLSFAVIFTLSSSLLVQSSASEPLTGSSPAAVRSVSISANVARTSMMIVAIAAMAFLLSAPVLLPVSEFMGNCHFYKQESPAAGQFMPFCTLLGEICFPVHGPGTAYIGAVAVIFLFLAPALPSRKLLALAISIFAAVVFFTRPGVFETIFNLKPFSYILPLYGIPVIVFQLSLLAGYGLDAARAKGFFRSHIVKSLFLFASLSCLIMIPWAVAHMPRMVEDYDPMLRRAPLDNHCLAVTCTFFLLCGLAMLLYKETSNSAVTANREGPAWKWNVLSASLVPLSAVLLNFVSLAPFARQALPPTPAFEFKPSDAVQSAHPDRISPSSLIAFLKSSTARFVATDGKLMAPNVAQVFAIKDLRILNPFRLKWYHEFMRAAGTAVPNHFWYEPRSPLSKLMDIASVRYVVSKSPVRAVGEPLALSLVSLPSVGPVPFVPGIRLDRADCGYDAQGHFAIAHLRWTIHERVRAQYESSLVLLNDHGIEVAAGDGEGSSLTGSTQNHIAEQELYLSMPADCRAHGKYALAVRLHELWPGSSPTSWCLPGKTDKQRQILIDKLDMDEVFSKVKQTSQESHQFNLLKETDSGLRLYENTKALPQAYVVHQVSFTKPGESALSRMSKPEFAPHREAILEPGDSATPELTLGGKTKGVGKIDCPNSTADEPVSRLNAGPNRVSLLVTAVSPGVLVLTDTYYPGWKATVDGVETPIYRANHMFRAVQLPRGRHRVEMRFEPLSFWLGVWLCAAGLAIVLFAAYRQSKVLYTSRPGKA